MSYGTKEWSEINSGRDDEINELRYQLLHMTAERDHLAIKLTRWEESWMAQRVEQLECMVKQLKNFVPIEDWRTLARIKDLNL